MISKEMFCRAMAAIQADAENNKKLSRALENYLVENWVEVKHSSSFNALLDLLKELFHDFDNQLIEWWLWDHVEKKIYDNENNVIADLTSVEDFYDYLVQNITTQE